MRSEGVSRKAAKHGTQSREEDATYSTRSTNRPTQIEKTMFLLGSEIEAAGVRERTRGRNPVRIMRIIDRLNIGGPAKHVTWLTAGLDNERYETTLVIGTVPAGEGDMNYFALEAGITPVVIDEMSRELGVRDIVVICKLLALMFRLKPEIVHTHKAKAGAAGRIAAVLYKWCTRSALFVRPRKCKIVHTYHGHIFHGYYGAFKTRLFLAVERFLARFTDRIITISESQKREINGIYKVGKPDQFSVIPLGLDLEEGRAGRSQLRVEARIEADEIAVGVIGRLCEVKNHRMLIEAAAILLKRTGELVKPRFVIVGDGHLRGGLEDQAAALGISDSVVFAGFRDDVLALCADLDLVALTSVNEGTPLTLIEGMSAGKPVVATEVGGIVDLMGSHIARRDGFSLWEHGVTAPSGDPETFAAALEYLIERPELRREMGLRAKSFVHSSLSRRRLVTDMETLYGELAETKKRQHSKAGTAVAAR